MGGRSNLKVSACLYNLSFVFCLSLEVISCHLGAGCSVAASEGGISKDTSMGFSPGEGLMMGVGVGQLVDMILVPGEGGRLRPLNRTIHGNQVGQAGRSSLCQYKLFQVGRDPGRGLEAVR